MLSMTSTVNFSIISSMCAVQWYCTYDYGLSIERLKRHQNRVQERTETEIETKTEIKEIRTEE